ncbi:MAG: hypothetical protein A3K10_03710 [Bacteroidetes bacterium RIFCSPLOWO2_12_FULL_31_6]|nr:MAG: hypothetical protein A3K10_03710 [Bacteroidetes bacterium RIFCSPLOWO2_12_FULL_31_6]
MRKIELRAFTTWVGDNEICYTVVKPNAVVELTDAMENTSAVKELSEGKVYPMLVNLKEIKSITKEARDHFAMQNRTPGVNAMALLIKSPSSTIIGNFFLGLHKSSVPAKLFTNEEKAITWLKQFHKK